MKMAVFAALVSVLAVCHAWSHWDDKIEKQLRIEVEAIVDGLKPVPSRFLEQPVDHFNTRDGNTFQQRWFVNETFWDGSNTSPVFVCVGGEGPPLTGFVVVRSIHCNDMVELAPKHNALLVAVEHRFYGESLPFGTNFSTSNLAYLSSQQALADLALFHGHVSQLYELKPTNKWVTWGGSYPGMLAGWARLKYPHLFFAAVSSSSPIKAEVDFQGYNDIVAASMSNPSVGGSELCANVIRVGHEKIGSLLETEKGREAVTSKFNVCGGPEMLQDSNNVAMWVGQGVVYFPVQENDPACQEPLCNIASICSFLTDTSRKGDEVDALAALSKRMNGNSCTNVDYAQFILRMREESNTDRVWEYQTCNEFSFYQTCERGTACIFTQGYNTIAWQGYSMCELVFGISKKDVQMNVDRSNAYYGGHSIDGSRIVFPNGQIDPWHGLGLLNSPYPQQEPTLWVTGASHHAWTHPASTISQESVRRAKHDIWKQVDAWLDRSFQDAAIE